MPIPANGWLALGVTQDAPVLPVPLPVPFPVRYRDFGGPLVVPGEAVAVVARIVGDAEAAAQLGLDALGALTLEATVTQTGAFMAALLDALVLPSAFAACGVRPDTAFAACGVRPVTAFAGDAPRPASAFQDGPARPVTAWSAA